MKRERHLKQWRILGRLEVAWRSEMRSRIQCIQYASFLVEEYNISFLCTLLWHLSSHFLVRHKSCQKFTLLNMQSWICCRCLGHLMECRQSFHRMVPPGIDLKQGFFWLETERSNMDRLNNLVGNCTSNVYVSGLPKYCPEKLYSHVYSTSEE